MKNIFFICFILICVSISCKKDTIVNSSVNVKMIVFGEYGSCYKCADFFKIENKFIYSDTSHNFPGYNENYYFNGEFIVLNQLKQKYIDSIKFVIPDSLYKLNSVIGSPNTHDQGGMYFEIQTDSIHKSWWIDNDRDQVPVFLYGFIDQIKSAVEKLK